MRKQEIVEYFEEVETSRAYKGYFCSIPEAISIVVLGNICGLRNISQIHQWAESDNVSGFLKEKFGLQEVLEGIEDTRRRRSVWYPLYEVLFIMLTAVICGATSYAKVEMFGKSNLMDNIVLAIEDRADTVIRQAEELYKSPVYKYPGSYARENGELEQYRASNKANIACREAIEKAVNEHYSHNCLDSKAAVKDVVGKFGYDRTLYVLAVTVRRMDWDGRISSKNKEWARTMPVFEDPDGWGNDRNACFVVSQCHPGLTNMFITEARHEYLLSLPLTKEDIKAEALNILCKFQDTREPNSPNGTHYMAQISPDFLARAKDTDRLMAMLPFQSLSFSTLEGRRGTYALITRDEDRFQKLVLRKPSVRKKLQQPLPDSPAAKKKPKEQER